MPGGDRTGPAGAGAMTGRGLGYCAGYATPGFANPVGGRGRWNWFGGRGGRGRWNWSGGRGGRAGSPAGWSSARTYGARVSSTPVEPDMPTDTTVDSQELDQLKQQLGHFASVLESLGKRIDELESRAS